MGKINEQFIRTKSKPLIAEMNESEMKPEPISDTDPTIKNEQLK